MPMAVVLLYMNSLAAAAAAAVMEIKTPQPKIIKKREYFDFKWSHIKIFGVWLKWQSLSLFYLTITCLFKL